jgi:acyl carrier protein
MKLSKKSNDKNKIISIIQKFFDIDKIEETARATNFVQRESKLDSVIFFSVCVCLS